VRSGGHDLRGRVVALLLVNDQSALLYKIVQCGLVVHEEKRDDPATEVMAS